MQTFKLREFRRGRKINGLEKRKITAMEFLRAPLFRNMAARKLIPSRVLAFRPTKISPLSEFVSNHQSPIICWLCHKVGVYLYWMYLNRYTFDKPITILFLDFLPGWKCLSLFKKIRVKGDKLNNFNPNSIL